MPDTIKKTEERILELENKNKAIQAKLEAFADLLGFKSYVDDAVAELDIVERSDIEDIIEDKFNDLRVEISW